jgi:hypothetical protein
MCFSLAHLERASNEQSMLNNVFVPKVEQLGLAGGENPQNA